MFLDLTKTCDYIAIWLHGQKEIKVNHHPVKFCDHIYCGSGNIIISVCNLLSQGHVVKCCSNFMGRIPSWQFTSLLSRAAIGTVIVEIRFSCDLARPRDQNVIWLYRREPIKVSYHPAKFGGHRHCGSGDIMILVCHVIKGLTRLRDRRAMLL